MSNFRVPNSGATPPGVPPNRPARPPQQTQPASAHPAAQPTAQPLGQFGPALPPAPPRPRQPPTVGMRPAQSGTLRKLGQFLNSPHTNTANSPQPGNVAPGPAAHAVPPVGFSQPYPPGGPGTPQPYAQRYQATTQPNRGMRYVRAALLGGGLFAALPSLQLLAALPSGGGGLGAGTLLGFGIPIILRSFVMGAGLGAATSAARKYIREKRAQGQPFAGQGQPPGMPMQQMQQMQPMQPPGGMFPPGYAPAPVQAWGQPQPYAGQAGAPAQWPVSAQPPWLPPGGMPAAPSLPQPPAAAPRSGTFGPPQDGYYAPPPSSGRVAQPMPPPAAQPVIPDNASGAKHPQVPPSAPYA